MAKMKFVLEKTKGQARAGWFETPHGVVQTPIFMPVGTQATVKSLDSADIASTQAGIILANTYHLYLRPGMGVMQAAGGVHKFMNWSGPMLTDSGGFQVFSLGKQLENKTADEVRKFHEAGKIPNIQSLNTTHITEEGVKFTSHLDGSSHFFTPQKAIAIQQQIGADIMMAFDECTPDTADEKYTAEALERTHRWAQICYQTWEAANRQTVYGQYQALFGIIQGAMHRDLRRLAAQQITALDFDGIAVGGETIGYNMLGTAEVMGWLQDLLPAHKPRYAMGLGRDPQDLVAAVKVGFDMFDCVGPTRLARNGALYAGKLEISSDDFNFVSKYPKGRVSIGSSRYATDFSPIDSNCDCQTCTQGYTKAYLHHLYKTKELSYYRLASVHNVRFMVRLSHQIRQAILA